MKCEMLALSPVGLLITLIIPLASSGPMYGETGSDLTVCNMTCSSSSDKVDLIRTCGGIKKTLLELYCLHKYTINTDSRVHLNTRSGCWTLSRAQKGDSCVYEVFSEQVTAPLFSQFILILDPVLITNITSNGSRLGEDIAVSVHYSGEESAVTWELEVESFPERYWLIDDNRTLIIPSLRREDAQRTFRVRVTNPISEGTREYQPEIRESASSRGIFGVAAVGVSGVLAAVVFFVYQVCKKRDVTRKDPPPHSDHDSLQIISEELHSIPQEDTGFIRVSVREGKAL